MNIKGSVEEDLLNARLKIGCNLAEGVHKSGQDQRLRRQKHFACDTSGQTLLIVHWTGKYSIPYPYCNLRPPCSESPSIDRLLGNFHHHTSLLLAWNKFESQLYTLEPPC